MKSLELTADLLATLTELQQQLPQDINEKDALAAMQQDLAETEKALTAIKKTLFILDLTK